MKKISIIVPVYNTEKYLGRCIESIRNQTYSNLEIILVDDGSNDDSLKICHMYAEKDDRIKVLHTKNFGVSNARNIGIKCSTGEYIGFIDSDDYIEKTMYETLVHYFDDKVLPICTYNMVDENKRILERKDIVDTVGLVPVKDFFLLCENILLNSPVNKLYESDIIKKNNIRFDTDLSLGEDFLFVMQYLEYIEMFYIIDMPLYNYMTIKRESLSQLYRDDFYEIQRRIIQRIKVLLERNQTVFDEYKTRFYTFSLDLYVQALNNTEISKESLQKKIKRNNEILSDYLYEECLKYADMSNYNKCYVALLKRKKYQYLWLYTRISGWIKRRKKLIKLYYHGGSGNHGCEAIVRGTKKILNTDLVLYSMRADEDEKYGLNKIINLQKDSISKIRKNSFWDYMCRIHRKITGNTVLRTKLERYDFLKEVRPGDIYLSIGGDNYCYPGYEELSNLNRLIKKKGGKTVLWGCSVEPDIINQQTQEDFKRYDLIIARESISYEALKQVNNNTKLFPDPAFALEVQETKLPLNFKEGATIGINLSPLIMKNERFPGITLRNYKELIEYILKKTDYHIALISHVVWAHDDDREAIVELLKQYGGDSRVSYIMEGNAPQLKWVISNCKMFIGARTHSTIAAYSTCVPTLVIGYSVKARGIAKDLFGTDKNYVVPVQSLINEDDMVKSFIWLESNFEAIKQKLEDIIPQYCEKAAWAKQDVFNLF